MPRGRKPISPNGETKVPCNLRLPTDVKARIVAQPNQAQYLERLVREDIEREARNECVR